MRILLVRRVLTQSLGFMLLLVAASGAFAHYSSPLRDPNFQPDSANAGSLLPWLQGVHEGHWIQAAAILAALLAINLTLLLGLRQQPHSLIQSLHREQRVPRSWVRLLLVMNWVGIGIVLFLTLWLVFVIYLLTQWLLD